MAMRRVPVMSWVQPDSGCKFVVGNDSGLRLYRISPSHNDGSVEPKFDMVEFRPMRHAATAIAAYPRTLEQSSVMAVGNSVGEVGLHFYSSQETSDPDSLSVPPSVGVYEASGRVCREMAFNPEHNDLLACGFDHKEGHPSLHIYDITRNADVRQLLGTQSTPWSTYSESLDHVYEGSQILSQRSHARQLSAGSGGSSRPDREGEYGPAHSGSGVTSLSWIPGSVDDILVASKKTRCSIRWYDLRARNSGETFLYIANPGKGPGDSGCSTAGTVYDLQFDPFNRVRYMAHDRCGIVNMWDIRWATQPIHTFDIGKKNIARMRYSPRRSGVIAALAASSSALDIFTVHEYSNGKIVEGGRFAANTFLDDARMKERYDDDRAALVSASPPKGLHVWTRHTAAVPTQAMAGEQNSMFLWIPPVVSSKASHGQQLITWSNSDAPRAVGLPIPRVAAFNCRGDMAISNNWSRLGDMVPSSDTEMSMFHIGVAEFRELALDRAARHAHAMREASAEPAGRRPSAPIQQRRQSAVAANSLLARRYQAARQQSLDGSMKAQQLSDTLIAMNLNISSGQTASGAGAKTSSPLLYERLASGAVVYDPSTDDGRVPGDDRVEAALAGDILVQMRRRVMQGYGINADKNTRIFSRDSPISDLWQWIRDADIRRHDGSFFVASRVDASFYGIYDIMKLKKKQLNYLYEHSSSAALKRRPVIRAKSKLNRQRRLALQHCGWGLEGYVREQHIMALEHAGEYSRAAGASFVYGDHERCLQSLEQSTAQDQKLLSFMLKAQMSETSRLARAFSGNKDAAPGDMFACPHLQMIFMYLVTGDWNTVIENMGRLPLSHRLAVALRYLDDASLMRYLRRVCRLAVRSGGLDGLIVTGIASYGMLVLGQYVDDTADVQTAALVATFDPEGNLAAGEPAERWIYAYRHLLNKWRMFTTRCLFDIAHGNRRELKGLPRMSKVGQEISIRPADVRCTFCHQSLGYDVNKQRAAARRGGVSLSDRVGGSIGAGGGGGPGVGGVHGGNKNSGGSGGDMRGVHSGAVAQSRVAPPGSGAGEPARKQPQPSQTRLLYTHCPKCSNSLPRCVVCRMTLGTPVVSPGTESDSAVATGGEFSQWFSWCQTCGHGGHVSHLKSWFSTHAECPIPGCSCECEKSC